MPNVPSWGEPGVVRRFDALFRAMSTDFLLREQFVTDPAQVVSEFVYRTQLEPGVAATINRLVYSVAANAGLLTWIRRTASTRSRTSIGRLVGRRVQSGCCFERSGFGRACSHAGQPDRPRWRGVGSTGGTDRGCVVGVRARAERCSGLGR